MPDTNIDKSPHGTFAAHLMAKKLRAGADPDGKNEDERLAFARTFRIERRVIPCLKTMQHANDRVLDDDPQIEDGLIRLCHASMDLKSCRYLGSHTTR